MPFEKIKTASCGLYEVETNLFLVHGFLIGLCGLVLALTAMTIQATFAASLRGAGRIIFEISTGHLAALLAGAGRTGGVVFEISARIRAATTAACIAVVFGAVIFGIRGGITHHLSPLAMVHTSQ